MSMKPMASSRMGKLLAAVSGLPGRVVSFLHYDGLARLHAGAHQHRVGPFARQGGGRIGTFFDGVGVSSEVLDVTIIALRFEAPGIGGLTTRARAG